MITSLVVNDTQVDMGQEFTCNISNFLMSCVIVDSIMVVLRLSFAQLHVVNTNTVVRKGFSVNITNGLTDLKELLVRVDGELEFTKVIV